MLAVFPVMLGGMLRLKINNLQSAFTKAALVETPSKEPIHTFIMNNIRHINPELIAQRFTDARYGMTIHFGSPESKVGVCIPTSWTGMEYVQLYFFCYKDVNLLNPNHLLVAKRRHQLMFTELGIIGIGPIEKSLKHYVMHTKDTITKYPKRAWHESVPEYLMRHNKQLEFIANHKDLFDLNWYDSYTAGKSCQELEGFTNEDSKILHNLLVRPDYDNVERRCIVSALRSKASALNILKEANERLDDLLGGVK